MAKPPKTALEEFLDMTFSSEQFTLDGHWLLELQRETKALCEVKRFVHSARDDFWASINETKLKDCREDKASILAGLKSLLEHWYEAPLIIADNPLEDEGDDVSEEDSRK